jgi:BirA family biotin operon repressor/biotin-[acetyl-CoA-carboxylase] ligase
LSALFRPATAGGVEVISLRVGLAVAEALEPLVSRPIRLKWPNDLMLGERKIGGILCEARWQGGQLGWVAAGLGVNIRNPVPADLKGTATRLAEERPGITVDDAAEPIAASLRRLDLAAERLSPEELDRFAARDWLRYQDIRSPVYGTVIGLSSDGSLLVRAADGSEISVRSGSVELATVSSTR